MSLIADAARLQPLLADAAARSGAVFGDVGKLLDGAAPGARQLDELFTSTSALRDDLVPLLAREDDQLLALIAPHASQPGAARIALNGTRTALHDAARAVEELRSATHGSDAFSAALDDAAQATALTHGRFSAFAELAAQQVDGAAPAATAAAAGAAPTPIGPGIPIALGVTALGLGGLLMWQRSKQDGRSGDGEHPKPDEKAKPRERTQPTAAPTDGSTAPAPREDSPAPTDSSSGPGPGTSTDATPRAEGPTSEAPMSEAPTGVAPSAQGWAVVGEPGSGVVPVAVWTEAGWQNAQLQPGGRAFVWSTAEELGHDVPGAVVAWHDGAKAWLLLDAADALPEPQPVAP